MQLNLPGIDQLAACRNLLLAGMGGGFDLYCGLPIYFELRQRGVNVHLASLSFSPHLRRLKTGVRLTETLIGATAEHSGTVIYFPEMDLTRWFAEQRNEAVTIWCLEKTGGLQMAANYRALAAHLDLDGFLLIDGGCDSLLRGDESMLGTLIEDALSLAAVNELDFLPLRQIACLGFGAEREVPHAHMLENVAALAAEGAFLGACALVRQMEAYRLYEEAVLHVHARAFQDPSVINASVISAVQGHYGDYHLTEKTRGSRLWISPLMSLYWFFDLAAVAARNLFLSQLATTTSPRDALTLLAEMRRHLTPRAAAQIPLP